MSISMVGIVARFQNLKFGESVPLATWSLLSDVTLIREVEFETTIDALRFVRAIQVEVAKNIMWTAVAAQLFLLQLFVAQSHAFVLQQSTFAGGKNVIRRQETTIGSEAPVDTILGQEKYDKLLDWSRSNGVFVHDQVSLRPSQLGNGYGAFVNAPIAKDELLLSIPYSACVTLDQVFEDPRCGVAFKNLLDKVGPGGETAILAGFLAKEWLVQQHNNKSKLLPFDVNQQYREAKFADYLEVLPWVRFCNQQEHILYWDDEEVDFNLMGTVCYQEAMDLRAEVKLAIRVLNGIVGAEIREYRGETSNFNFPWQVPEEPNKIVDGLAEAVRGAFVSLLTRAFLDGEEDEKLVPLLDLLQHSDTPNIRHDTSEEDGTVEVRARRDLEAGEELLNQYHAPGNEENMPKSRFFTRYGFIPGNNESIKTLLADKTSILYPQRSEV